MRQVASTPNLFSVQPSELRGVSYSLRESRLWLTPFMWCCSGVA